MKYPVMLEKTSSDNLYQITVPDLPGCQEKASSIDSAINKISQVIASHLTILAEYGEAIPNGKPVDYYVGDHDNVIWAIVDIDISPYLGKSHKINVTLPELLIKKIDDRVAQSAAYKTRSGFIASACLGELQK